MSFAVGDKLTYYPSHASRDHFPCVVEGHDHQKGKVLIRYFNQETGEAGRTKLVSPSQLLDQLDLIPANEPQKRRRAVYR